MIEQSVDQKLVAKQNYDRYVQARDRGHADYVELSKKCNNYYRGEQWDPADVAKLDREERPHLTINEILPTVNTVLGEQARTRSDAQFKPRGEGDISVAEALNKVYMQIYDANHMEWNESLVFADGVIGGRGYFDVRMNFDDNIRGDVQIVPEDPHNILIDPDAKEYDPKTWKEVFKTKWLSLEDIELLYGKDNADQLRYIPTDFSGMGIDSILYEETFADDASIGANPTFDEADRRTVRSIRVIERQYRKMRRVRMFVDNVTGDMNEIPDAMDELRMRQLARTLNMSIMWKMKSAIRWTVSADNFLLFDGWSPYEQFTIVPFFAYFRRGKPFGVVENLLSPQDNLNKVASQELHVVNTTANSGWMYKSGTLVDMDRDDLARDGAKTGLVLEVAHGADYPEKIQPNQIPTGLDRISMKAAQFVREISGVSESLLGYDGAEVSGVAIQTKQSRGLIQMQTVFDNLNKSRHFLAERILELVQRFYTEERLIRVTEYVNGEHKDSQMVVNQMTPEGTILNDLTLGKYDVVIASVPARDTFDESQFAEVISLRNVGVMIPDDAVVQYSNLAHKGELAQRMRELSGQADPTEEELQHMAELQQLQMRRMYLELAELEGKAEELKTRAQLNMAKAEELQSGPEGDNGEREGARAGIEQAVKLRELAQEQEKERQRLAADIQLKREQYETQLKIATMSEKTKLQVAKLNAQTQRAVAREKPSGQNKASNGKK